MNSELKNKTLILKRWLTLNEIPYIEDLNLKKRSWLKCGGISKIFIEPSSIEKTINLIKYLVDQKISYYPVGNLSNILIREGEIYSPIINLKKTDNQIVELVNNDPEIISIKVSSGLTIFKFIMYVINTFKISGLEGMIGIPGTIGGAMLTNASSYDSCISDYLYKVKYINKKGEIISMLKDEINFSWRSSVFQKMDNFLITEVYFNFPRKNIKDNFEIQKRIEFVKTHRQYYQEKKYPNLGSLYATKNLYSDLSKLSIPLFMLYLIYVIGTKFIYMFSHHKNLLRFRKFIVKLYRLYFKIDKKIFSMSDKTINCLINTGSSNADEAISTIQILEKKIKGRIRLENIILRDLK